VERFERIGQEKWCVKSYVPAFLVLLVLLCAAVRGESVDSMRAQKVVRGWLRVSPEPLGLRLGRELGDVETFSDANGEPLYHVVYVRPSGFVIVAAEDTVEPIIAFCSGDRYDPSQSNPLGALVSGDVPARVKAARALQRASGGRQRTQDIERRRAAFERMRPRAQSKWSTYAAYDEMVEVAGVSSVSDVRVAPLLQSEWGQTTVGGYTGGITCYNYYTPSNWPCGCVATAMSQLIRYHQYPSSGPSGAYVWGNMPLVPDSGITLTQRQAIGHLCFDAAESVDMTYGQFGSFASLHDTTRELRDTFGYSNSIHGYNNLSQLGSVVTTMVNPNIDAGYPVLLGIDGPVGGHAVVCDGYGYNSSTLYHHINMGWDGRDDAWYDLPVVDAFYYFDVLDTCVYNVYESGSGEIISGRITGFAGAPLSGASVTATGGGTYYATSDSQGVYALAKVPSNTTFTINVSKGAWEFSSRITSTGASSQDSLTCGNVWGIDFAGTLSAGFVELDKTNYTAGETVSITLTDSDLLGDGSAGVTVITVGGDTETVSLGENPADSGVFTGSIVTSETAIVVEDGTVQVVHGDTLTVTYYDADDGTGSPATSEDTAGVTGVIRIVYETDFSGGLPGSWSIVDGLRQGELYSWNTSNTCGRSNGNWSGTFMIVDSDCAGEEDMDEELVTPSIDCSYYSDVSLKFSHYFKWYSGGLNEIGDVDVRVNGGPWQNVARYQGQDHSGRVQLDLSAIVDGEANVQIRWRYYNANFEYYWGIDNVEISARELAHAPSALDAAVSTETGVLKTIELEALDDGRPGAMSYVIETLPRHGTLSDPGGGAIGAGDLPYVLLSNGNEVVYSSFGCFTGADSFTFSADDGGTPPDGGVSNTATISVEVSARVILETAFEIGPPVGWTIIDGYSDGETWFWAQTRDGLRRLMVVDSDSAGEIPMDEQLVSNSVDCSDYDSVILTFEHLFAYWTDEIADVDVRIGGGSWQNVARYQGADANEVAEFDISSIAAGQADVQVRWHYYNANWEYWWIIYNAAITGPQPSMTGDFEGDCGVSFKDFPAFGAAWQSSLGDANWDSACDVSEPSDGVIDGRDLAVFADNWLEWLAE